jgi:hypothetical protein
MALKCIPFGEVEIEGWRFEVRLDKKVSETLSQRTRQVLWHTLIISATRVM